MIIRILSHQGLVSEDSFLKSLTELWCTHKESPPSMNSPYVTPPAPLAPFLTGAKSPLGRWAWRERVREWVSERWTEQTVIVAAKERKTVQKRILFHTQTFARKVKKTLSHKYALFWRHLTKMLRWPEVLLVYWKAWFSSVWFLNARCCSALCSDTC